MAYAFYPNSFAPKCPTVILGGKNEKLHSVSYNNCNFNCEYCFFRYYKDYACYKEYSNKEFESMIKKLTNMGTSFKFTGGEPTLNPHLMEDLRVVKKMGGVVYLDTNGSRPEIIEILLREELVDFFGISLKGLEKMEAVKRSGISNAKLCWDNVFYSMNSISKYKKTMIITYVVYDDFCLDTMNYFADIIEAYPNVFLKINNFQSNKEHKLEFEAKDSMELRSIIKEFVGIRSEWKGRITLIENASAIENIENVEVY